MKKNILFCIAILFSVVSFAQETQDAQDTTPAYIKNPHIPEFYLIKPDSSWFKSESIPKGKKTVIVYFNSQCEHCQLEAQSLGLHKNSLKDVSIIMTSYHDTPEIIGEFIKDYKLDSCSNIIYGQDPVYAIPSFFKVRLVPFVAVYDQNGLYKTSFQGGVGVEQLLKILAD